MLPAVSPRLSASPWLAALALAAGCGRVGYDAEAPARWIFVDDDQADFDLGRYDAGAAALAWQAGQVRFAGAPPFPATPNGGGLYVSRPHDTGDDTAIWETLAWLPVAPQGRPLPDGGAADAGYAEGGVSMADNLLLLHLDGAGAAAHGDPVPDASGLGHHGHIVLAGQGATHVGGAFRQALDLDRDAWVTLDGFFFDFGTGDFTWAVWVKMRDCADSNDNRVAMGGGGAGDDPHVWIGAACPERCAGRDGADMIYRDGTRMGPSLTACTGVVLDDGAWHHLASVKRGHTAPPAAVTLYVDGREVAAATYDFGAATFSYDGGEIRLGGFNLGGAQYNTRVTVDEAAMWKRALGDAEIAALFRRGAVHLELQVRACADGACDSEPFLGPDGAGATWFTEADWSGAAGDQKGSIAALGLVGALGQYRARFATAMPAVSPGLLRVTLEARRP